LLLKTNNLAERVRRAGRGAPGAGRRLIGTALFFTACHWAPEKNQKNAQIMACDKKRKKRFIGPCSGANKTRGVAIKNQ
jgi:hypothetical protein